MMVHWSLFCGGASFAAIFDTAPADELPLSTELTSQELTK
jgi:hypothetical protein